MTKVMKVLAVVLVAGLFFGGMSLTAVAQDLKPQETCPIMEKPINKAQFIDVDGMRFYVCCPGCFGKIKDDPAAAVAKLKDLGEYPVPAPEAEVKAVKLVKAQEQVKPKELKPQETCPIMGKAANKAQYVDVNGFRYYVCCAPCIAKIEADPAAANAKLKELGEFAIPVPINHVEAGLKAQESCPIMGKPINKDAFIDVAGHRFYTCCPGCNDKIKADPAAATAKLKELGEGPLALPVWDNNFEYAKKLSATNKKPILVNMTGSDWCGWCIKLKEEVFSKKEFKDYATANLNLFYADFPRKIKLPENEVAQNAALRDKFSQMKDEKGNPKFRGYPTIFLLNAKGDVLAKTGYQPGGPVEYVKHLKELIAEAQKGEKYEAGFILPDIAPTNGEAMECAGTCEGCAGDMGEVKVEKKIEIVEKVKK